MKVHLDGHAEDTGKVNLSAWPFLFVQRVSSVPMGATLEALGASQCNYLRA